MKEVCELCSLCSPNMGCTKLSHESCLKEAIKLIKPSVTNGEVIKAIFPDATITQKNEYVVFLEIDRYGEPKLFDTTWWNRKWGE